MPEAVIPLHYNWLLNFEQIQSPFVYANIEIKIKVTNRVRWLYINTDNLTILNASFCDPVDIYLNEPLTFLSLENSLMKLECSRVIYPGEYLLRIFYILNVDVNLGITKYPSEDGSWIALTNFQNGNAQSAVPCWEDRRYIATWSIQVKIPLEYNFKTILVS
ncbi:hypothetical protein GJ496_003373 [Pomphorhynchus laevis]|nr:hypothetical protein GJ496_003373 [Pomphorhynchus laevis]